LISDQFYYQQLIADQGRDVYLHPDLRAVVEALPANADPFADIAATRAALKQAFVPPEPDPRIEITDRSISGPDGQPLGLRIYRPSAATEATPVVVWFHGGGFVLGDLDIEDHNCRPMCAEFGVTVVSVDYRLAPEHRYPAGFDDCYHALCWAVDNAEELGVDPGRLALAGHSSGGALAAATALAARDRQGPAIRYLFLGYPALDDRQETPSARTVTDPRILNGRRVRALWDLYLGDTEPDAYAAPARATDVSGLPSTYLLVTTVDPFRDEGLDWARRLVAADVPAEMHLVPGAPHMFDSYGAGTPLVDRAVTSWRGALAHALHQHETQRRT
jgi:acetyl esterase/lipase